MQVLYRLMENWIGNAQTPTDCDRPTRYNIIKNPEKLNLNYSIRSCFGDENPLPITAGRITDRQLLIINQS
ncbi:hypothetical protein [Tychonema sp. LEGE 07203]|uniref:hypothetical protein n=1 Tax=Tychonema sp. LEGE 07203 TaxID=1828671 RepID=UPI0018813B2E|nr:hypothetical protein [Tychonema sp. LEGE 07203]MBE9094805.1 hypothetical protein [Tychonema sp. LEGE 07203]